ncbi:MAG TPA: DUF456 domain-containing protein [Marmoricola sp.]|jgi:hypothetical protein|nr:DUF456 domain-containing protein [Marmoricola sp.]
MTPLVVLTALAIALGLIGILVPLLPGTILIGAAVAVWAVITGTTGGWITLGVVLVVLAIGTVVKYLVPGRQLKETGVPTSTLLVGAVLGVLGFFAIPAIGLPLGFALGIYLAEARRLGQAEAGAATIAALRAVLHGVAIEHGFGVLASLTWAMGAILS